MACYANSFIFSLRVFLSGTLVAYDVLMTRKISDFRLLVYFKLFLCLAKNAKSNMLESI